MQINQLWVNKTYFDKIKIFHQPGFPWNKGGFPSSATFWGPSLYFDQTCIYMAILCDLFGMIEWPFPRLSDLQLRDQKITLNHLVYLYIYIKHSPAMKSLGGGVATPPPILRRCNHPLDSPKKAEGNPTWIVGWFWFEHKGWWGLYRAPKRRQYNIPGV